MAGVNILYIGDSGWHTTSRHRAEALRRLGHNVVLLDPYEAMKHHLLGRFSGVLHFRTGYRLLQREVSAWLSRCLLEHPSLDVAWVDSGELIGSDCLMALRSRGLPSILFNHDDATGTRDGRRFDMLKRALPFYDASVAVREESADEYRRLGASNVILSWRTYDEIGHQPYLDACEIPAQFRSEIAFIGTWMAGEDRDRFLLRLLKNGIPVNIWGGRWQKSPLWKQLAPHWRGAGLGGRDYVAAIQGSKISLGMLSRQNRDRHTTRSMEIPYAGGLLCAERTKDHLRLYQENIEAVFWSDVGECIEKCKWLLGDAEARERIRDAGMTRVRQNKTGNEDLCRRVLDSIGIASPLRARPNPGT